MPTDRQLIDALCRLNGGWSLNIPGDQEDYRAAIDLVQQHGKSVSGTFRQPTVTERFQRALQSIAGNTCCANCQEAARVAKAALRSDD